MIQIFVFGSSSTYGVGGQNGGWVDILKQKLHNLMFREGGVGEKYEFFNFAKSGEPISFVLETFKYQLEKYRRKGKVIILVSIGGNNSKAHNEPNSFVSTIEEYKEQMTGLLKELKNNSSEVILVGGSCVDESKTNPKFDPLTGGKDYFTNNRKIEFEQVLMDVCKSLGVNFVKVQDGISNEEWINKYQYIDGLHPNQAGHELIAEKTWQKLKPLLD